MCLDFDPEALAISNGQYTGGRFIDVGGEEIPVRRPPDHRLMQIVRDGSASAVEQAVEAARRAFAYTGWAKISFRMPARVVDQFPAVVEAEAELLGQPEASSRLITLTISRDAVRTAGVIRYYTQYCDKLEGEIMTTQRGRGCPDQNWRRWNGNA